MVECITTSWPIFRGMIKIRGEQRIGAYFEIAELGELLAAVVETTQIWLCLIVNDLVGADVAALCELFAALVTLVWTFACVSSFVCLVFLLVGAKR